MALGVSYDDFWFGDPDIVRYALAAHDWLDKRRFIEADTHAWMQGYYAYLGVAQALSDAFSKTHNDIFPKEPIFYQEVDPELKAAKRKRELEKAHAAFRMRASLNNLSRKRGERSHGDGS